MDLTRLHLPGLSEAMAREDSSRTSKRVSETGRVPEMSVSTLASNCTPKVGIYVWSYNCLQTLSHPPPLLSLTASTSHFSDICVCS